MTYADLMRPASQREPLDARQIENNAGGHVFALDAWARLDRFLVLGSDAPTYYQSARALTRENAAAAVDALAADPARAVARVVAISQGGRAPRNAPALFALALGAASPDEATRRLALAALPRVARTASHLFEFVGYARALGRGWGRTMKRAVAAWYDARALDALAFQAVKYRRRAGYDHARLLRTAHPGAGEGGARAALYAWMVGRADAETEGLPPIVAAHEWAMMTSSAAELVPLIEAHRLPWEALPTWAMRDAAVWRAMLPSLGLTALVRNLGTMTRTGALAPLSRAEEVVVARLGDAAALRRARVHPFALLQAMAVYRSGAGMRGAGTWEPLPRVLDALDGAYRAAFANVEPTGARQLIALDVSGSMGAPLMGSALTAREGAAAMALITLAAEPRAHAVGFTAAPKARWRNPEAALTPLPLSPGQRLDDAVAAVTGLRFGATDCALPMLHALERGLKVDAFVVYTDNETWAGDVHPACALRRYRARTGIPAKLVVVGMTSTGFSIADPADGGMLDVVGFDAAAPAVIADFLRGGPPEGPSDGPRADAEVEAGGE